MIWILLCAGNDFKKSKESTNKVLNGDISIDKFRQNFRNALLHNKSSEPLDVNPTSVTLPTSMNVVYTDGVDALMEPLAIFKSIFINSNPDAVINLLARILPNVSDTMADTIKIDIAIHKKDLSTLSPYGMSVMSHSDMFYDHFRTLFKPNSNPEESAAVIVTNREELATLLRNHLVEAIQADHTTTSIELPTYVIAAEESNNEA